MDTLALWHRYVDTGDLALLDEVLADDCVFYSPVVHTPQRGRAISKLYLTGAGQVLNADFRYLKEIVDGNYAMLEFACEIDGIQVNGIDLLTFDDEGKISEFKVMVRPLKAVHSLHAKMGEMLEQLSKGKG